MLNKLAFMRYFLLKTVIITLGAVMIGRINVPPDTSAEAKSVSIHLSTLFACYLRITFKTTPKHPKIPGISRN